MPQPSVYMEVSEYPPPIPWAYSLFPCPLKFFFLLSFGCIIKLWTKFLINWRKIYYPSPDWSSAFCDRSANVLSVAFTVHNCFVHYTSVTYAAKSISWPFFVCYKCATHAFYVLLTRSGKTLIATETTFITGWTLDYIFCIFLSVHHPLPLSVNVWQHHYTALVHRFIFCCV